MNDRKPPLPEETIVDVLHFDPLAYAEEVTGKSYKEDKHTEAAGVIGHVNHGELKRRVLEQMDDSTFSNKLDNYLRIIEDIGFEQIYEEDIPIDPKYPEQNKYRIFVIRDKGILLAFDSYSGDEVVNGGDFHYQIVFPKERVPYLTSSSSPFKRENGDLALAGYHDCREAIRFNIGRLDKYCEWIVPWESKSMGCYLFSYMDWKEIPDYNAMPWKERNALIHTKTMEKFDKFPEDVKPIFARGFEELV